MLTLQPANPKLVKLWRNRALRATVGSSSVLGLTKLVQGQFSQDLLSRFPEYQTFLSAAVAISVITALFLTLIPKVISLSFAQVGAVTSLIFISYSLAGIFFSAYLLPAFLVIMVLAVVVMVLVFGQSLAYFLREKAYADFAVGTIMVVGASSVCLYPLYLIVRAHWQ